MIIRRNYAEWKIGDRATVRAIEGEGLIELTGFDGEHRDEDAAAIARAIVEATTLANARPSSNATEAESNAAKDLGRMIRETAAAELVEAETPAPVAA